MSTIERIYQKYISVFYEIDAVGTWIDLAAVRYALRAALRELAADQPGADIVEEHRHLDATVRQIERVLESHDSAVYADLAHGNIALPTAIDGLIASYRAALAAVESDVQRYDRHQAQLRAELDALRQQLAQLDGELRASQGMMTSAHDEARANAKDAYDLRQQLVQMDADNAKLAGELRILRSWSTAQIAPGKTRTVAEMLDAIAPDDNASWNDAPPATLTPMATTNVNAMPELVWPGELADWVEGLEKGRHDWRKLAKSVRWQLIANVVNQVKDSVQFDAQRPAWMTTSRAAALTFGDGRWDKVVERAHAGEVTP